MTRIHQGNKICQPRFDKDFFFLISEFYSSKNSRHKNPGEEILRNDFHCLKIASVITLI